MIVAETIYINRRPIGMVRQDSDTGQIGFSPLRGKSLLPDKRWRDVDELKAAVTATYSKMKKIPAIKPGFSVLLTENINQANHTRGSINEDYCNTSHPKSEHWLPAARPKADSSLKNQ